MKAEALSRVGFISSISWFLSWMHLQTFYQGCGFSVISRTGCSKLEIFGYPGVPVNTFVKISCNKPQGKLTGYISDKFGWTKKID